MPDLLLERGIGETRIVRIEKGDIVEARILLDEAVPAGTRLEARLTQHGTPAIAIVDDTGYLLPKGAPGIAEGGSLMIEVTRESIPGAEPWKRPMAKAVDDSPSEAKIDGARIPFPAPGDPLEEAGWSDLLEEARSGIVRFAGGELRISVTPAMTLIDVDGQLPADQLAAAGVEAAAQTIRRHGIGGSIGIDLPTVAGKSKRQQIGEALDAILPQPFERTSVNGFGFLQVVRPRRHASLFELAADRPAFEARALLRRAARATGAIRLAAHPAVVAVIEDRPAWIHALARQVGGAISLRKDASLPISGGHAEPA